MWCVPGPNHIWFLAEKLSASSQMQQNLSSGGILWARVGSSQDKMRTCQKGRSWSTCSVFMAIFYSGKTLICFREAKALELGFAVLTGRWLWIQKPPWGKIPSMLSFYDRDANTRLCCFSPHCMMHSNLPRCRQEFPRWPGLSAVWTPPCPAHVKLWGGSGLPLLGKMLLWQPAHTPCVMWGKTVSSELPPQQQKGLSCLSVGLSSRSSWRCVSYWC